MSTAEPLQTTQPSTPFIRSLASSRRETRQQALVSLRTYLGARKEFSLTEYRKLWTGLFFCLYMQDKPRNQQALSAELAELLTLVPRSGFVDFVRAFYITMRERWEGLDRLRLDKFLYLIRRVVRAAFEYIAALDWEAPLVEAYLDMIQDEPLHPTNVNLSNGLRFHIAEVWIDELEAVDTEHVAPAEALAQPLRRIVQDSRNNFVRKRVQSVLDDERWRDWPTTDAKQVDDKEDEWTGIDD